MDLDQIPRVCRGIWSGPAPVAIVSFTNGSVLDLRYCNLCHNYECFTLLLHCHSMRFFSPRREVSLVRSRHAIMEKVWTLIRRRAPWRLICVYTVCLSWSHFWICHYCFSISNFFWKKSTLFLVRTILTKFYIMPYNSFIPASKEIDCMAWLSFLLHYH